MLSSSCVIWLLSYKPPKSRRDLWNTLYMYIHIIYVFYTVHLLVVTKTLQYFNVNWIWNKELLKTKKRCKIRQLRTPKRFQRLFKIISQSAVSIFKCNISTKLHLHALQVHTHTHRGAHPPYVSEYFFKHCHDYNLHVTQEVRTNRNYNRWCTVLPKRT